MITHAASLELTLAVLQRGKPEALLAVTWDSRRVPEHSNVGRKKTESSVTACVTSVTVTTSSLPALIV